MDRWQLADTEAVGVNIGDSDDLASALAAIGLARGRPVVVLVGGAGGLDPVELERLRPLVAEGLVPVLEERRTVAIDGGTDAGIMQLLGQERARQSATFPLVGVVAKGTVKFREAAVIPDAAEPERHHTHFVVVPGKAWGAEAPWIARIATALARSAPSVTVLVNGGKIAFDDAEHSIQAGRPVLVVAGTGRTADRLDAALRGQPADERTRALAESGLLTSIPAEPGAIRAAVGSALD